MPTVFWPYVRLQKEWCEDNEIPYTTREEKNR